MLKPSYGFLTPDFSTANEVSHMQRTLTLTPAKEHTSSHTLNSRQSENFRPNSAVSPVSNIHVNEGLLKDVTL